VIRPRIFISRSLGETLSPELLRAAIAHEEAHLVRRDPLARLILGGAGVFALPRIARAFELAFRDASEEACDASAARNVGDPFVVADALVSVARLQLSSASGLLAFGASALERRVRALIDGALEVRSARFLSGLALAVVLTAAIAGPHHGAIHHTVETLLSKAF
jgi:Zn-dependent protease with chaperone function